MFEEVSFATALGDRVRIRFSPDSQAPTHEARVRGRLAARELRLGVEVGSPGALIAVQRLHQLLIGRDPLFVEQAAADLFEREFLAGLIEQLELALDSGRLLVVEGAIPLLGVPPELELTARKVELPFEPTLAPAAKARPDKLTLYEVRYVDEIGQGIGGFDVELSAGAVTEVLRTNPAGVALLEDVASMSGSVGVVSADELERAVEPRWRAPRSGTLPSGPNTSVFSLGAPGLANVALKPAVPNTIVVTPPLGRLFIQLWDKSGRVRHRAQSYTISGPTSFSGETDALGMLLHDEVFHGDYTLSLTVETFEGEAKQVDTYESPIVVLPAGATEPLTRQLGVVSFSVLARLRFFFNTNKTFLLPTALPGMRMLRRIYTENNPSELLVVGHADTAGDTSFNDQLSLERAKATIAFLQDDVDAWLAFYEAGIPEKRRWGAPEDRMMLISLPDFPLKPPGEDAVRWFQQTRGLSVDGKAGPQTRRQLITEYMDLDGATLNAPGLEISATAHGCGEHFPLDGSGELDAAPEDGVRDPGDRRVELFFFEPEFGIAPKPPAENSQAGSSEYLEWRSSVIETIEVDASEFNGPQVILLELMDAHFRTNSAVVLPEGEAPSNATGEHAALTSAGLFAQALRYCSEHTEKSCLVAGHTDTTASVEFNQTLSEERAQCSLALFMGGDSGREAFKSLCDARHTVADYKQILSWVARAFEGLAFDCDPGTIDDNEATGVEPVRRFQRAYNVNKAALGASGPDLADDGDVGPLTWGAFFDCYEFALREELGVDAAGLEELRARVVFVDPERKALGFSEHFPVEELGVDNFRSQSNRRVELLFFDPGEAPDLAAMQADPETAVLYLPGQFVFVPFPPLLSVKGWRARFNQSTVSFGESRSLELVAPDLPAGVPLTWTLSLEDSIDLTEFTSVSTAGGGTLLVDDWVYPEMFGGDKTLAEGEEFDPVVFSFRVEGGGRGAESTNSLLYSHTLRMRLAIDIEADGAVFPEELPYVVHTLAGSRRGTTKAIDGEHGFAIEEGLPPGGATILVEDAEALRA